VFDQGAPEETEEGGSVYEIYEADGLLPGPSAAPGPRAYAGGRGGGRGGRGGGGGRRLEGPAPEGRTVELVFGDGQVDARWLRVRGRGAAA
jgi:hypothetical protein